MTDDTKSQLGKAGATLGLIAAAFGGLFYVANQSVPLPVPAFRMAWDDYNPTNLPGTLTAEFWSSTNLVNWYQKTNVSVHPGSNFIAVSRDKPQEFFRVWNRHVLNGVTNYSVWNVK